SEGASDAGVGQWSLEFAADTCTKNRRLLCLEWGVGDDLKPFLRPGALAFVTSATGNGDLHGWAQSGGHDGAEAGDAICRSLAAKVGLPWPDSFVAWLSTDGAPAIDRLTIDGP